MMPRFSTDSASQAFTALYQIEDNYWAMHRAGAVWTKGNAHQQFAAIRAALHILQSYTEQLNKIDNALYWAEEYHRQYDQQRPDITAGCNNS
jgi:hypothetical protein